MKSPINIFWFRRDLRLDDNNGLTKALDDGLPVLPIFIFDDDITHHLPKDDPRLSFIYSQLQSLNQQIQVYNSGIYCLKGSVSEVWNTLIQTFTIKKVYTNEDYEPYALERDSHVEGLLKMHGIDFHQFKDQVIFAKQDIVKDDGMPYTIYTPYKNKWLNRFSQVKPIIYASKRLDNYVTHGKPFPQITDLGFQVSDHKPDAYQIHNLHDYHTTREFPSAKGTSHLGPYLRFGTLSIRSIVLKLQANSAFLNELIWREFFMQILYHFPKVVAQNFKSKYDGIQWLNDPKAFEKWTMGQTGYPMVDAGIRELNATGYMHNRVRMVVASFLCKHLLIDWRWGEAYFAQKLMDYELAANNGNWQWAAGTGCDAAPYFRVFNPTEQAKKFDPDYKYITKWIPEVGTPAYVPPIVDHKYARTRAINTYKIGLSQ